MSDRRSRHRTLGTYTTTLGDREVELLIPREGRPRVTVAQEVVAAGTRLDLLADSWFGDPQGFWRIADANPCRNAEDLLEPGQRIDIPERRDG